ncbi:MAG TPA: hypothetical protein VHQ65_17105, partial [Thermoanaerobaculia bacterium]|nr:hypothetical protein [Thermoanaerobaculia bacterium]
LGCAQGGGGAVAEVRFRLALDGFEAAGTSYPAGTLFVPRLGNPPDTAARLARLATAGLAVEGIRSSFTGGGLSLGSERMVSIGAVRAGLVAGAGVLPSSFGALWHLLDQEVETPVLRLDLPTLGAAELADLDVVVLPGGYGYTAALAGDAGAALEAWVRAGGVLVALGEAVDWVRERGLVELAEWQPGAGGAGGLPGEAGEGTGETTVETAAPIDRPLEVPGAVIASELRQGHPLGAGLPSPPPMLVLGSRPLLASGQPQTDVLTAAGEDPVLAGFAWPESRERIAGSLLAAVAPAGHGKLVLFAQDPAFRGFWRGTMPLLLNAVLYGPYVL